MRNIETLVRRYRYASEFCVAAGIKPSYLSQLRAQSKSVGNNIARKIERAMGLEVGWLDTPHRGGSADDKSDPPTDTMSVALALESIADTNVRDQLKRTVLAIAQSQVGRNAEPTAPPFTFSYDRASDKRSEAADNKSAAG